MPFSEVNLVPSVQVETTLADNPSGISESNFIRWKANLPEKRGGCSLFINQKLDGIPNDIQPWADLNNTPFVSTATNTTVYAYNVNDTSNRVISPRYADQPSLPIELSTIQGETTVELYDPSITGLTTYNYVTFNTPASVGGLILQGTYPIVAVNNSTRNRVMIDAGYRALTTVTNGGVVPIFDTILASTEIKVTFPIEYQYGKLTVGDRIGFDIPTVVGGCTIFGQYIITKINSPTEFVIVDDTAATSSQTIPMNGNKLSLRYWVTLGPAQFGSGYGTWAYGQYGYGQGYSGGEPLSGQIYAADNWYLDNRGSALIASAVDGPLFYWDNSRGSKNLTILNNAPYRNKGAFVSMPYGHVMAWGCSTQINPLQDPMFIRWSDAKDPNNWSIAGDSDAGFYNVPTGSRIVRGIQGQTQQYWFTDVDLYSAQYVGYPGTYGFNKIGNGCGLIAPKAVTLLGGSLYWMSQRQFFVCPSGGAPQPIPCTVWDFIFQNLDLGYEQNVIAGSNSLFNEVTWFFPTKTEGNPGIPEAYVCFNAQYNEWDYGYIERTAWFDQSLVGEPIATDANGYVYQHETSNDLAVGSATVPINAWLKTGYFSITNGQDLSFVDWFLPDMIWGQYDQPKTADLSVTFYVTDYAGQDPRVYGPYPFNKQTQYLCPRFRGRFVSMKIESNDLASFWRLGSLRYRFAPSGRR
jgi:hypothetical protein